MIISLDFSVIKCNQGHINNAKAEECSICGEVFDDLEKKELLHETRQRKLEQVFNIVAQKESQLRELREKIRGNTIQLDKIDNEHEYIHRQINILQEIIAPELFEKLDLTSEALASDDFHNTLTELEHFYSKIYNPIINTLKFKPKDIFNKNAKNRLLRIALATKSAYITFLDCTIVDSLESAKEKEMLGQEKLNEISSETRILDRLYSSASIDSAIDLFSNGGMNYSAFSALTLFNQNEGSIDETIKLLSQDSFYYFRKYLTKNYEDYKVDDFLLLSVYMNGS
ncbi:MAG: hypothetical protein JXN65_01710 [Clostridia bacterium]|nr:hypothetical protein [Clostridia bacterium]